MPSFRGIPISALREHYMQHPFRNEMFTSMIVDCHDGNAELASQTHNAQEPKQRIWELNSDDDGEELSTSPASAEEEEKSKKKAKNKKKYLRRKEKKALVEKALAEGDEKKFASQDEDLEAGLQDDVTGGVAGMAINEARSVSSQNGEEASKEANTAQQQQKLSKRQKKTLLKKAKKAKTAAVVPRVSGGGAVTTSIKDKSGVTEDEDSKKEIKIDGDDQGKQGHDKGVGREKEVITEAEVETVMATVAKRFGQ